jgi:dolichol-phosphate mannosyltransferase
MILSVILPTYNEAQNIARIISAITKVFSDEAIEGEVIVVDDDSPDGTAAIAADLAGSCPVKVRMRTDLRGLSRSVIEGFGTARGDICVVMDADLSHPVDLIPDLIEPILAGNCDIVVGSRYRTGGGVPDWPRRRRLLSRAAGFLAKGVTTLSDPTSGFMAVKRDTLEGVELDPRGWKVVLEVVVKAKARVLEIPIVFRDRARGRSKFGVKAQVDYLRQLGRLYAFRYPLFRKRRGRSLPKR